MALTNPWTNPLRRSFQDIKADMLTALQNIKGPDGNPLITDISEGNIFVIIISLFAAIAEVLHFYIDNMARECFISTARRYSSVQKQGLLVDYKPRGANAATVDVVLTRQLNGIEAGAQIKIPKGTEFTDTAGNHWESERDVIWSAYELSCIVPLIQHQKYNSSVLNGTKITSADAILYLDTSLGGKYIEQKSVTLTLGGTAWTQVDTFAYSKPSDKHFLVTVDENDQPMIIFGDGKFGSKPTVGSTIQVTFYITAGGSGNVTKDAITTVPNVVSASVPDATCNNPYGSGDGLDYEDIDQLRSHIPLHARTMAVAITKQDFIDCAKLVPGVNDCAVDYICGKRIDLYISPVDRESNGGIASSTLCNNVKNYLEQHAPMATWLHVFAAGIAKIHLTIDVTGKPSYRRDEIQNQILRALYNQYAFSKAKIGGKVRISDIYALIDNLESVDYLYIKKFYVGPWPKIIYGDKQLDLSLEGIDKATGKMTYILSFSSANQFSIYSTTGGFSLENQAVGNVTVDDQKNGFNFSIKLSGSYAQGNKYAFTISEPNHDYEEPGFNQVVFDSDSLLTLTINETV